MARKDVRCEARVLHFKVIDDERIEITCTHPTCTDGGAVVLHRFNFDGELVETLKFQDPARDRRVRSFERKHRR